MLNNEYKNTPFNPDTQTYSDGEFKTKEDLKHAKIRSKKHKSDLRKLIMKIPGMFKRGEYDLFFDSFENILENMDNERLISSEGKEELLQQAIQKMNIPGNMGLKTREYIEGLKEKAKTKPREAWESIKRTFKSKNR